jgi:ribokinase
VIKPNAGEARTLTGVNVTDRASAREAAQKLLARGARVAAVTAGREGNLIVSADGEWWFPRLPVKSIDATGAGDAFAAALGVMISENRPLAEAGAFANAAAALTTTIIGAQQSLPTREAVIALQRRYGTDTSA